MEIKVNSKNFNREVLESDVPVVIEFYATDSRDCYTLDSVISTVAADFGRKVKLCKIDINKDSDLAEEYGVSEVPMLICVKDGEMVSWLTKDDIISGSSVNEYEVRGAFEL